MSLDLLGEKGQTDPQVRIKKTTSWSLAASILSAPARKTLTFTVLVALVAYGYVSASRSGSKNADKYTKKFEEELDRSEESLKEHLHLRTDKSNLDANIRAYLVDTEFATLRLARGYLIIVKDLYRFYYGTLFMSIGCSALAAMLLVFVTRHGWRETDDYVLITFTVLAISAATFLGAIATFQYGENIEVNKKLYLQCLGLEGDINTFLVTSSGSAFSAAKKEAPAFLREVSSRLKECEQVTIGFDPSKVKSFGDLAGSVQSSLNKK
jgi:hypothetical protein